MRNKPTPWRTAPHPAPRAKRWPQLAVSSRFRGGQLPRARHCNEAREFPRGEKELGVLAQTVIAKILLLGEKKSPLPTEPLRANTHFSRRQRPRELLVCKQKGPPENTQLVVGSAAAEVAQGTSHMLHGKFVGCRGQGSREGFQEKQVSSDNPAPHAQGGGGLWGHK